MRVASVLMWDPATARFGNALPRLPERNWWDVPYHFLLDLDGRVFEGRDWRYMGETNTTYDPGGHFLISIIGNYERQEPTPAQLDAIADLMAWALREFDLPLDRIGGHYHYASTGCPGQHLRRRLEDGTLRPVEVVEGRGELGVTRCRVDRGPEAGGVAHHLQHGPRRADALR